MKHPKRKLGEMHTRSINKFILTFLIESLVEIESFPRRRDLINLLSPGRPGAALCSTGFPGKTGSQSVSTIRGRHFIVDSGATMHLISLLWLTKKEMKSLKKLSEPIALQTANGLAWARQTVRVL